MPVLGRLHVPRPRAHLVARPRLTDRLGSATGPVPRLVLVSAPAGFGKTTVLTQWLSTVSADAGAEVGGQPPVRAAWLSLDPGDSDLRRFLTHLVAAVRAAVPPPDPDTGAEALRLLEADGIPPVDDVLVSLVNDLDALSGRTVIALDDYHVVDDGAGARGGALPPRQPSTPGDPGDDDPRRPAAVAAPAAGPRRARRGAGRRPALHRGRGGRLPQRRHGARAARPSGRRPRGAHRGLGRRSPARGALGRWPHRQRSRRRAVRRGLHRQPPLRARLPPRGGARHPARRHPHLPPRHLRARRADRRPLRRADRPHRRAAVPRGARAGQPLRPRPRRRAPLVALPPPLRGCRPLPSRGRRPWPCPPAPRARGRVVRRGGPAHRRRAARARRGRRRAGRRPRRAGPARPAQGARRPAAARLAASTARGRRTAPPASRHPCGVGAPHRRRPRWRGSLARRRRPGARAVGPHGHVCGCRGIRGGVRRSGGCRLCGAHEPRSVERAGGSGEGARGGPGRAARDDRGLPGVRGAGPR